MPIPSIEIGIGKVDVIFAGQWPLNSCVMHTNVTTIDHYLRPYQAINGNTNIVWFW